MGEGYVTGPIVLKAPAKGLRIKLLYGCQVVSLEFDIIDMVVFHAFWIYRMLKIYLLKFKLGEPDTH